MSAPQEIASTLRQHGSSSSLSPIPSPSLAYLIPSPIITKRTRTISTNELAMEHPIMTGTVKYFCRVKGHGFIKPCDGGENIFVHVSDIDGEYVPRVGDEVSFRLAPVPPKCEKMQAVHVQITNFTPEVHMRWQSPLTQEEEKEGSSRPTSPIM